MTSKAAALEHLRQRYPEWVLGGTMNSVWVEKDGERVTTGFRGDRNCRQLRKEGLLEEQKNEKGLAMYRFMRESSNIVNELAEMKRVAYKPVQESLL